MLFVRTRLFCAGIVVAGLFLSLPSWAESPVERGRYLVTITGCSDCHTPMKLGPNGPEPDLAHYLAGHPAGMAVTPAPVLPQGPWLWTGAATNTAFSGPWGVSFAVNLTPDPETGLGKWREEDFVGALTTGKHMGVARPILPPMPWPGYARMTPEDLKAMFAYLRTGKPVVNRVPEPVPPAVAGR